jgi:hypothetical protein
MDRLSLNDKCVALIISLSIVVPQECLLSGLHSVSDGELPMIASDFYAKHVLPAKAEGTALHSFATGYVVSPVKNSDMRGVWLQEQALISRKLPTRNSQSYFQPSKRRSAQTNCIEACALQCMPPFHTISWTRLHRQSWPCALYCICSKGAGSCQQHLCSLHQRQQNNCDILLQVKIS